MRLAIVRWAQQNSIIRRVYVFGSRARGTASAESDLDLALVLDEIHGSALSELIVRRTTWRDELTRSSGVCMKDIYLADDSAVAQAVRDHGVLIFARSLPAANGVDSEGPA